LFWRIVAKPEVKHSHRMRLKSNRRSSTHHPQAEERWGRSLRMTGLFCDEALKAVIAA